MDETSEGRCARRTAGVLPRQPWRRTTNTSALFEVFLERDGWRKTSGVRREERKYESQEGEEDSCSSSEGTCNDVPFRINERLTCIGCNKRRPSFSDTESVLDIVKMPVGTANSILKSSFSLTSLRSSTPTENHDHGTPLGLKTERPYHSLTKKSRKSSEQDKELWRKSWGSGISQDGKEFWEGFQADYDYLMAQNILDRDASEVQMESVPGGIPRAPLTWSHSEFMDHFAQLYSWLKGIQDSVYGKQENVTDWKLRAERQEVMQRQRFRLDNFNEESKKLVSRHPESEGEVLWRVKHINDKWETVEAMMGGCGTGEAQKGSREKVEHEIKCLRRWLREIDAKLKPLSFHQGWSKAELEAKTKEHMVLHRDIEGHRKIVSSLLKLCEKAETPSFSAAARALERKYHEFYLRSLEWQCHIESLVGLQLNKNPSAGNNESDGEPVAKIARIASSRSQEEEEEKGGEGEEYASDALNSEDDSSRDDDWPMDAIDAQPPQPKPASAMVGAKVGSPEDSILGLGSSSSKIGTKPKNVSVFVSCANRAEEATPVRAGTADEEDIYEDDGNRLRDTTNTAARTEPNRSKSRPPNTGTFTWTHLDTDSEQEKAAASEGKRKLSKDAADGKDAEATSSEDGWTFVPAKQLEKSETGVQNKPKAVVRLDFEESDFPQDKQIKYFSAKNIPRSSSQKMLDSKEPISSVNKKLVELADELVRCKSKPWKPRRRPRRDRKEQPMDSCDASGEYTTEDPDEADSQVAEDEEDGLAARSAEGLSDGARTPLRIVLRSHRHALRHRPWSMSSVSWPSAPRPRTSKPRCSMSESALNQMTDPGRGPRGLLAEGGSSRRRRAKNRRRISKKSESGSEEVTLSGSDGGNGRQVPSLVKSGSFSGVCRRPREFSHFESATGTETDEEPGRLAPPVFRLGPTGGVVTMSSEGDKVQAEEQLSLNWDNYQDKYQSEAYSEELPDSYTDKKLLEFGEDYGKYLGYQSDCASTASRSLAGRSGSKADSDSDVDDVRNILRHSVDQLDLWEMKFNKVVGGLVLSTDFASEESASRTFFDEVLGACKRNVDCLTKLLEEVKDEAPLAKEHTAIQNVKESWESLKSTAEAHKAKQLRAEMAAIKSELEKAGACAEGLDGGLESREDLEAKIGRIQNELHLMKKNKSKLLQANVAVHKFLSSARRAESDLRDEVTELYQLWDQTFSKVSSRLLTFQSMCQTWHEFEDHLAQLQVALKSDALKVLDFAVKCGTPSAEAGPSLQDIATILYAKDSASKDSATGVEASGGPKGPPGALALSTEGSLSDSGISDSGSEQELNEREKRLAQLKRLAKSLESILAPGSQALASMFKRIEQAETELREIQMKCRDLIVRSASTEEIRMIVANAPSLAPLEPGPGAAPTPRATAGRRQEVRGSGHLESILREEEDADTDAETEAGKPGKKFWFWRLLRFALPFQLALVALLCVACMVEPRCCDSLNNLDLSLNPQLRYDSGPPPV